MCCAIQHVLSVIRCLLCSSVAAVSTAISIPPRPGPFTATPCGTWTRQVSDGVEHFGMGAGVWGASCLQRADTVLCIATVFAGWKYISRWGSALTWKCCCLLFLKVKRVWIETIYTQCIRAHMHARTHARTYMHARTHAHARTHTQVLQAPTSTSPETPRR